MVAEGGANHARKTHEEQNIRSAAHFRHSVPSIGLHVHSVRQPPYGYILTLSLASRLRLRLSLGLRLRARLSLLQNLFYGVRLKVRVRTISLGAPGRKEVCAAPLIRGGGVFAPPFADIV